MVLLTHHHGDHIGGAEALAARWGVPIAAHAATARRLAGVVRSTRLIADGETVHGPTAVHTPGHAEGHLCFEVGGATIAGDMVAGLGTILIDPSEGRHGAATSRRSSGCSRAPAKTLLPAHGPVIADGPAKLREYSHTAGCARPACSPRSRRRAQRRSSSSCADAYADTPRVLWPLAERSLRAHLDQARPRRRARATARRGEPL